MNTLQQMSDAIAQYIKDTAPKDDDRTILSDDKLYRYYQNGTNRYFYCTNKSIFNNKLEYVAGILHFNVNKKEYIRENIISYKKKKDAMKWALKEYEKTLK